MKALFQNPKAALAYVAITLVSVALVVGTEDDPGTLYKTVETLGGADGMSSQDRDAQRKFGDPMPGTSETAESNPDQTIGGPTKQSKPNRADDANVQVVFADDKELIDDAKGFDPTPKVFGGFKPKPANGQPFLSDQDEEDDEKFGGWADDTPAGKDDRE